MCETIQSADLTPADLNAVKHPFERAGLGKAPFRFVGVEEKIFVAYPGAEPKAGGTCDYCSMGIRWVYHIRSADGRQFGVGCDCVMKLNRDDNRLVKSVEAAAKALKRKLNAEKRAKALPKENARIAAAREAVKSNEQLRSALASEPHPFAASFRDEAEVSRTALDYVEWMFLRAGHSGQLRTAKEIEKRLAAK